MGDLTTDNSDDHGFKCRLTETLTVTVRATFPPSAVSQLSRTGVGSAVCGFHAICVTICKRICLRRTAICLWCLQGKMQME
jgi:hypothetical protein